MNVAELESGNAAVQLKIQKDKELDLFANPYYGFYDVTIFDCPSFVMFTADDCPRAADILGYRSFETMSMRIWCKLARGANSIFDIGAHVGVYSLAAASLRPELSIHAFEPNPYAFARLRVHKKANRFFNITEHTIALGNATGITEFEWVRKPSLLISSGGHFGTGESPHVDVCLCFVKPFDELFSATEVGERGLIKIDVEGAEAFVFKGMSTALHAKPDIILESFSQEACDFINSLIKPLDYNVFLIKENACELVSQERLIARNPSFEDYNQLLTLKSEHEIRACLA